MLNKQAVLAALAAAGLALAIPAGANTVNGSFNVSGTFTPYLNSGGSDSQSSLGEANELDFNDGTPNPGTPGTIGVSGAAGDFTSLFSSGETGTIQDLAFTGTPGTGFSAPTITGFETFANVTVDLLSIGVITQTDAFLHLSGTTTVNATGFSATPGTFDFTAPVSISRLPGAAAETSFSFLAGNFVGAQVPEPSALLLCGIGLTLLAVFTRKRAKRG